MYWLSKRVLPTPALEIADPALTLSYRLWSDLRLEGHLPARCQLDSPQFRLVIPEVQWIGPLEAPISEPLTLDGIDDAIAPEFNAQRRSALLSHALTDDLRLTQFTGSALFQIIDLSQRQSHSTLQLLFLPFADDGLKVIEILVVARLGQFAMDVEAINGHLDLP